ncbi:MAG: hypothetical protein V3T53_11425 [Phycisphaerales bacterium]
MAKKKSKVASRSREVTNRLADLHLGTLREVAPRSSEKLIDAGISLLEAHREFLAEGIDRLQRAKQEVSKGKSHGPKSRKVSVTKGGKARKKKRRS